MYQSSTIAIDMSFLSKYDYLEQYIDMDSAIQCLMNLKSKTYNPVNVTGLSVMDELLREHGPEYENTDYVLSHVTSMLQEALDYLNKTVYRTGMVEYNQPFVIASKRKLGPYEYLITIEPVQPLYKTG